MHCSKAIDPPFQVARNLVPETMIARGSGPLVGVSPVAADKGSGAAPAYSVTKALVSLYLDGLRESASRRAPGVRVIEVAPGFVRTDGLKADRPFRVASPDAAAEGSLREVSAGRNHA